MTTDTDTTLSPPTEGDPMEDVDAFRDLSRDEQSAMLDDGLADLKGEHGSGAWRHLTDAEQRRTREAIERDDDLSETERAMQAALETTWTAALWAHDDDVPTVEFECRELSEEEQAAVQEMAGVIVSLEGRLGDIDADADEFDADDLPDLDAESQYFASAADLENFVVWLLADVTVDDAFDEERFRTGHGLRSNTRTLLLSEIVYRYQEEQANAIKFRTDR